MKRTVDYSAANENSATAKSQGDGERYAVVRAFGNQFHSEHMHMIGDLNFCVV